MSSHLLTMFRGYYPYLQSFSQYNDKSDLSDHIPEILLTIMKTKNYGCQKKCHHKTNLEKFAISDPENGPPSGGSVHKVGQGARLAPIHRDGARAHRGPAQRISQV